MHLHQVNLDNVTPIEKRLYQLFGGWMAQFENMPEYRPNIKVSDGKVYVDEQYLCKVEEKIEGCEIDVGYIVLYTVRENTDTKLFLNIEWQDGSQPFVREIEVEV